MLIALNSFQGMAPRINPRKLSAAVAQIAVNVDLDDGTLNAIRSPQPVHTFPAPVLSFFKDNATWLGFPTVVSVARGPVAQDRLYYTGDGAPKMRVAGTVYNLALPAPVSAPTVTNLSAPGSNPEAVLFAYTWVTSFGEESQPSPLSAEINYTAGVIQRVSGFAVAPSGRGITHIRIYRSQTSLSGATELFFAAEVPVATVQHDYDAVATPLGEAITTKDFDPPPAGLSGLIAMPNGMMAAFVDRELYFCEPYQPHAWPEKYTLVVNSPILGLAAFGSSIAILTAGAPYVAQGIAPDQMAMEVVESGLPCMSGRSIVDMGYSAVYASSDGLMLVGEGSRRNMTEAIFSREQWKALNPSSIFAARFKNQYVFIHNSSEFDTYDGGDPDGWGVLLEDDLDGDGPALSGDPATYTTFDFGGPFSSFGEQTISWIDTLSGEQIGLISSTQQAPIFLFSDPTTNNLYILDSDGVTVKEWLSEEGPPVTALWRSKRFASNVPVAPGALYVETAENIEPGSIFKVRVYGDGILKREITEPNTIQRLPADTLHTVWEMEIETTVPVTAAYLANSPDEILVAIA